MSDGARGFSFSIVICVRLHEQNPWVLDRLRLLPSGAGAPPVVVVDFGSQEPYAAAVKAECARFGLIYLYFDDDGVFSLSLARNIGFRVAATPYVLFSDIDFVFRAGDLERLEELIGGLRLDDRIDQIVNLPAYHLTETATERWLSDDDGDRDAALDRAAFDATFSPFGKDFEFIAPYSNVFLINAKFFELIGGYDVNFRGHGSEDFEFLTRVAIHSRYYRLPRRISEDRFSPSKLEFFKAKDYIGYRRLIELICLPTELLGLKTYHLWHPRITGDEWRDNNDWKRTRLKAAFEAYLTDWRNLLGVDFLPREKLAVCVCANGAHDGYFYPLRLAGYRLHPLQEASEETLERISVMMENGLVNAFAIFNPYMISHRQYKDLFDKARLLGIKTIVIERGALPNSIYYSSDVCYADESFSEQSFLGETFSETELSAARRYVFDLRGGASVLERGAGYAETRERLEPLMGQDRRVIFVPLQLPEDMAVTMFVRDAQVYADFVASIGEVVARHPDVLFVVKPHPLSGAGALPEAENVFLAEQKDNIHCLIDLADAVVCYNSGVGLLSILHEKRVVTVGNAFYNIGGVGRTAGSFEEAVDIAMEGFPAPDPALVERLCAWFICRKYSSFVADDDIRTTATRKIHGYKNILVTALRLDGVAYDLGRMRRFGRFERLSYGAARLNINELPPAAPPAPPRDDTARLSRGQSLLLLLVQSFVAAFYPARFRHKVLRAPRTYIRDSRNSALRWLGRRIFGRRL